MNEENNTDYIQDSEKYATEVYNEYKTSYENMDKVNDEIMLLWENVIKKYLTGEFVYSSNLLRDIHPNIDSSKFLQFMYEKNIVLQNIIEKHNDLMDS